MAYALDGATRMVHTRMAHTRMVHTPRIVHRLDGRIERMAYSACGMNAAAKEGL